MTTTVEERIAALEARTAALERNAGLAQPPVLRIPRVVHDDRPAPAPAPAPAPRPRVALEDVLGGRLLAWVGGAAVALGLCFLLAIAVSRGWIGEVERTLLAGFGSLVLLAAGAWAQERRGRTDAARAAAAAGIAGLFATFTVAGAVYELVPALVALAGALAVGAAATVLALRWEAKGIAGLGILGALASPVLVGAALDGEAVALLLVATTAAAAVLLWQRWTWLGLGAFAIAMPQWAAYLLFDEPSTPVTLAVLVAFGAVTAASAAGFELRSKAAVLRIGSIVLLALNALTLALVGVAVLDPAVADGWLVGLALAHLAGGLAARRASAELGVIALALGVVLADVATARLLDGLPLIAAWAAGGLAFAALARAAEGLDRRFVLAGLGGHLLLALGHAMAAAPPTALADGPADLVPLLGLGLVAVSSLVSGRLAAEGRTDLRIALDATALAVLGYQTAIALDGVALTAALAAESIALAMVARRAPREQVAPYAALAYAGAALLHALAVLAPPVALVDGLDAPGTAALGLAAAAAAVALLPRWTLAARGAAALVVLYTASVELVTPFEHEQGQALLSALWGTTGVAVLVAGLVRDDGLLRRIALALLAVTAAKVFLFDLASLTSLYRAASFVAFGVLLLGGAFAWQRIRPQPRPDLRTVPGALR